MSSRTVTVEVAPGVVLAADIYEPQAETSTIVDTEQSADSPIAVLMLHGGAWRFGDRSMMRIRAEALAAHTGQRDRPRRFAVEGCGARVQCGRAPLEPGDAPGR